MQPQDLLQVIGDQRLVIGRHRLVPFTPGVNAPKLHGIADTSVVAILNADRVDGKHASDFTAAAVAPPRTSSSACTAGSWVYGGNYVYVCVATTTWKRAVLSGW